ncbi:hypothetical protein HH214_08935 [Mucilaginibacter robiniae]|uniref:Cobalt transporter n=1 Tax=Mucilaginibacter robiniae TaxID=2728022 RepID=A0A7L5E581_9SPHI|nr:hypothetical protein [Mucilaginibacter robiniae]QJD95993.1 hypothetical protein HH214_08935 [Mucilaginibacter robiniae]
MRKIGAISLAAFYLLLTTGAFACLLHCTETFLFTTAKMSVSQLAETHAEDTDHHDEQEKQGTPKTDHHGKKDDCGPGKDCKCCNKHGMYVVKENVDSAFGFATTALAIVSNHASSHDFSFTPEFSKEFVTWPHATGPPEGSQPPIYIKIKSLLI